MKRNALWFSIALNILGLLVFGYLIYALGGWKYVLHKMNNRGMTGGYTHKKELFDLLTIPPNAIVFLGNSITAAGSWSELLNTPRAINRGIDGDMTDGILDRLDPILKAQPTQLFLLIGVNDLILRRPPAILANYQKILERIQAESSSTQLIVQSILPINNQVRRIGISNEDIITINTQLSALCAQKGIQFLDIHSAFKDNNGRLDARYTDDGIHLNGEAYLRWRDLLFPLIDQLEDSGT